MIACQVESALLAVNAAWSGAEIFGPEHPTVTAKVREAADGFRKVASMTQDARVLWLPGRTVVADRRIDARGDLRRGVFAKLSDTLPDCLRIGPGVTPEHVLQLIQTLANPKPSGASVIVGPFSLTWIESGAPGATLADAAMINENPKRFARTLHDMLRHRSAGDIPQSCELEGLAADIASAATLDQGAIMPLASLKSHDEYTFVHAINVGLMASALCDAVGLSADRTREITVGAILHDVGKVVIPHSIIGKQGALTDAERAIVQSHPAAGAKILAARTDLPPVVLTIAYEHHMKINGGGYPHRPVDWRIGLPSQIVHIADVFDALRTHRPYRDAFSTEQALEIMAEESGTCYDAALLDVFTDRVVERVQKLGGPSESRANTGSNPSLGPGPNLAGAA